MLVQLPPKRRQIIRLLLARSDIVSAKAAVGVVKGDADASEKSVAENMTLGNLDEFDGITRSDTVSAKAAVGVVNGDTDASEKSVAENMTSENLDEFDGIYMLFMHLLLCQ